MARYEPRSRLLTGDDVYDVLAIEASAMAEKLFLAIVVVILAIQESGLEVPEGIQRQRLFECPAGEGSRGILDVVLGVVPYSHREQLQNLAAIVLVDGIPVILVVVEPVDHGRVARQLNQYGAEVGKAVGAKHLDVIDHARRVLALGPARRQDAMPEKRHLLLQRPISVQHPVDPAAVPNRGVILVRRDVRVVPP